MLPIHKISHLVTHTDSWKKTRLAKFTSSLASNLIGDNSHLNKFTVGALSYIEMVACEYLNGRSCVQEFFSKDTDWGNAHEPEALLFFEEKMNLPLLKSVDELGNMENTTHRLIIHNNFIGGTPDGLLCLTTNETELFSADGNKIKVATVEGKCPAKDQRFMKFFKCATPLDLKKAEAKYYWQVLSQMFICETTTGYFFVYHPDFRQEKQIKIIKFSRLDAEVNNDINRLKLTYDFALLELEKNIKLFQPDFDISKAA